MEHSQPEGAAVARENRVSRGPRRTVADGEIPVIDLSKAGGGRESWDRPRIVVYLWAGCELLFVTNAWQPSSSTQLSSAATP